MKTLEKYVFKSFLTSFSLAFLVLSFILTIALLVQIVGLLLDNAPFGKVIDLVVVSFAETLQWTVPIALAVSCVLVFIRLSTDSELAAMRACGVNLFTVARWPLAFALLCSLVCVYVNNQVVPRGHENRRKNLASLSVDTGVDMLKPGKTIDEFPRMKFRFGRKEGKWLYDLTVIDYSDPASPRMYTATKAAVSSVGRDLRLDLRGLDGVVLGEQKKTGKENAVIGPAHAASFVYTIKDALKDDKVKKKGKDYTFGEVLEHLDEFDDLIAAIDDTTDEGKNAKKGLVKSKSKLLVVFSQRFVLALAAFCFVMIALPLGVVPPRRVAYIVSFFVAVIAVPVAYYAWVFFLSTCYKYPAIHPEWLLALPVPVCLGAAAALLKKRL